MTLILRNVMLALGLYFTLASSAFAADPLGTWLTEDGEARVKIVDCAGALCGTVAWLKAPNDERGKPKTDQRNVDASKRGRPIIGVPIVLAMKPSGTPAKWSGEVYNAEDGKTYAGNLTMTGAATLRLEGCVMGGLVCQGQTWTRVN